MNKKLLLAIIAAMGILIVGCKQDEEGNPIVDTDQVDAYTLKPVGTISGKIVDRHTEKPVQGAVISIAFNGSVTKTTSDESGSFSFNNVPCNRDATTGTTTGTYQLTVSLVDVNKTIPDSLPKYREFYYNTALSVTYIDMPKNDSANNKFPTDGLEANIRFDVGKLNTTIKGQVVDENYDPVANAIVYLEEGGTGDVLQTTTTDAQGNYTFTKVEGGTTVYIEARSANGALEGGLNGNMFLTINNNSFDLRSQVNVERIMITAADNIAPYVVKITPENLSDVSPTGLTIVIKFSEPIKQTAYTVTNVPLGLGTLIDDIDFDFMGFKKSSGNTNFTLAWDTVSYSTLTITPLQVVGSAKYQLNIAAALGKLLDRANNGIVAKAIIGDFEPLNFTTNGVSAIPISPLVTRRLNAGLGFSLLNFTGGIVGLEWGLDNNARSYTVYRSVNDQPYTLLADNILDTRYSDNTGVLVSGYNPPGDRDPFKAFTVKYKVIGVSKDLIEGPESNIITVKDDVAPKLTSANVDSSTTGFDYVYLRFDEPLNILTAQSTSQYSISNLPGGIATQISEAVYLGWTGASYEVRLRVTEQSVIAGEIITVTNQVMDLIGNPIDPNASALNF
ncbi:MAG: carboxypeptidase regulatory-like domain-containing protein [Bacteroidota bacterium]